MVETAFFSITLVTSYIMIFCLDTLSETITFSMEAAGYKYTVSYNRSESLNK